MSTRLNTPMIRQYLEIKEKHSDAILFFRLGDFYEMFFDDAKVASKVLNIALTSRNKGKEDSVPLCGVPHHSAQGYIDELISNGFKVAICEQVEDPKLAKTIVKREVVQVITPGLITDGDNLTAKTNNFIMGISKRHNLWGLAYLDISTGAFATAEVNSIKEMASEITRIKPKEAMLPVLEPLEENAIKAILHDSGCILENTIDDWVLEDSSEILKKHFKLTSLESIGLEKNKAAISACAALVHYAQLTQKTALSHISKPHLYSVHDYMVLDSSTIKNLELIEGLESGNEGKSLFSIIDKTITPMGGRVLKSWLLYPLLKKEKIFKTQDGIEELIGNKGKLATIRDLFSNVHDIQRLSSRIAMARANARDMVALKDTLRLIPEFKNILSSFKTPFITRIENNLDEMKNVVSSIENSLKDDPALSLKDGGFIREGFNSELDELRKISKEGRGFIASLEKKEKDRTGITTLKVRYNKVFGYYIEVTKSHLKSVPQDYIRKQTLVNAERFITPELKEYEEKVLGAQDKIKIIEYDLFVKIREKVAKEVEKLNATALLMAELDCVCALSTCAIEYNYVRPEVNDSSFVYIEEGRHPVIERMEGESFIPNDIKVDNEDGQILIITGPNMAGKSTILRQAALITLLAQIGSFVPAKSAKIGIVDKIFTRVGARDRLSSGFSTFMVEMMETSNILHNATKNSLIILDEIGRGTSTFDGVSIAWAVAEYIHDKIGAKTLFATHYHELCDLVKVKKRVKNFSVTAKQWEGKLIFLRKLVEGPVNRSYGIEVARLAGLPEEVLERSREILNNLESGEYDSVDMPKIAKRKANHDDKASLQLALFREFEGKIARELAQMDLDSITPINALTLLNEWKKLLK